MAAIEAQARAGAAGRGLIAAVRPGESARHAGAVSSPWRKALAA